LERPIITWLRPFNMDPTCYNTRLLLHDEAMRNSRVSFSVGDKLLVWEVVERNRGEVLMKWGNSQVEGLTWFHIPREENVLVFGSAISSSLKPVEVPRLPALTKENISIHDVRWKILPAYVEYIKMLMIKAFFNVSLPIHKIYSKYLLVSTLNSILNERKLSNF